MRETNDNGVTPRNGTFPASARVVWLSWPRCAPPTSVVAAGAGRAASGRKACQHMNLRMPTRLFGHDGVVERIADTALSPAAAPLVMVTGPSGIGRSTVLAAVRERVARQDVTTVSLRVARNERNRPYAVATRLAGELGMPPQPAVRTPSTATSAVDPTWLAGTLAAAMAAHQRLVVFVDDAQWIDPDTLDALPALVRMLSGGPGTIVCGVRTPLPDAAEQVEGIADVVSLRPLHNSDVVALLTDVLQAKPSAELTTILRRSCRGVPGAVLAAVHGYQRNGSLRVEGQRAYLTTPFAPTELLADEPLFDHFRQQGDAAWSVVKSLAVLHPLGDSATRLIAEATGVHELAVQDILGTLTADGALIHGPKPGHWRFRLPLLTAALPYCLRPYERRRLSQLAVTAIWDGCATVADERYLPEQLVGAGRLVDPARAAQELLARGAGVMLDDGYHAMRWLRHAVDLITEPRDRAHALFLHGVTSSIHQAYAAAKESAWTALSEYSEFLTDDLLMELEITYVIALRGMHDIKALTELAEDGWRTLPGGEGQRIVTRAAALATLDRWLEADELFQSTRDIWCHDIPAVVSCGMMLSPGVAAFVGRMDELNRLHADPTGQPLWEVERYRWVQVTSVSQYLNYVGEWRRADDFRSRFGPPDDLVPLPDRAIAAGLAGEWDQALEHTRVSLANGLARGNPAAHTAMCQMASSILIVRGRLGQARRMIEQARSAPPGITHLLAIPEAQLATLVRDFDLSRRVVGDALTYAAEHGLLVGTDELWLKRLGYELAAGDRGAAQRCIEEMEKVARQLDTTRSVLCVTLGRAMAYRDADAVAEAVAMARDRGEPLSLATTLWGLSIQRLVDDKVLLEAYELCGTLDALLPRAHMRLIMRERNIKVPGRTSTVAENERLLAYLVTEGLTNRELAAVLGASEKSVEGRLTRLFQRTGYRSRVELTTAILTGEYPA